MKQKPTINNRYRVCVRYDGDEIRTHGYCAGISVPRIDYNWYTVTEEQLEQLRANPLFLIEQVIPLSDT